VAIELAVFRRGEVWKAGGDVLPSLSDLLVVFLDSHENGLVSFRDGTAVWPAE
jgi:hypothetical protein